ncbi:hypothetical protein ACJ5H2_04255 [Nocardioides sp. R1-1]|uniref:hypothetical protein n=1 Tax=Nocardioides sp. R1-1 TaxID=3383502 RepID=UPI0038D00300
MTTVAHAATTYTPAGGPGLAFVASRGQPTMSGLVVTLIEPAQSITCTGFSLTGSVVSPGASRAYGVDAATLGSLSASGCTHGIMGGTSLTALTTPSFKITGDATNGRWPARVANVRWRIVWANCEFYLDGTINGVFDPATQVFSPVGNPPASGSPYAPTGLVISATPAPPTGSMCLTLDLQAGDTVALSGRFTNTPPAGSAGLTVTSP